MYHWLKQDYKDCQKGMQINLHFSRYQYTCRTLQKQFTKPLLQLPLSVGSSLAAASSHVIATATSTFLVHRLFLWPLYCSTLLLLLHSHMRQWAEQAWWNPPLMTSTLIGNRRVYKNHLYWAQNYYFPWVAWNLVKKIVFICLQWVNKLQINYQI